MPRLLISDSPGIKRLNTMAAIGKVNLDVNLPIGMLVTQIFQTTIRWIGISLIQDKPSFVLELPKKYLTLCAYIISQTVHDLALTLTG